MYNIWVFSFPVQKQLRVTEAKLVEEKSQSIKEWVSKRIQQVSRCHQCPHIHMILPRATITNVPMYTWFYPGPPSPMSSCTHDFTLATITNVPMYTWFYPGHHHQCPYVHMILPWATITNVPMSPWFYPGPPSPLSPCTHDFTLATITNVPTYTWFYPSHHHQCPHVHMILPQSPSPMSPGNMILPWPPSPMSPCTHDFTAANIEVFYCSLLDLSGAGHFQSCQRWGGWVGGWGRSVKAVS